ncbi:mechanosensitive ion channel domain-containing protein [Allorhodopirellula solitaria]|uniref:Miniconductance mechanosensitive channel MscM n=1 Tax=Allorhodopirellula solitaria TaxID=2527987 RepID=A0A5C5YJN0_9BACT|nr:mechanosensitive ion channel domain-containing protein [Allorhodopirellula solitaria]TWT75104.1 Miniconductance mechanosensitive channel MscM precursor [Allorhodopirellula solitaria]
MMPLRLTALFCLALWGATCIASPQGDEAGGAVDAASDNGTDAGESKEKSEDEIATAIRSGQAEVGADSALDETLKSSLEEVYQSAQQSLQAADTSHRNTSRYKAMTRDADQDLAKLSSELQEPAGAALEIPADEKSDTISQRLAKAKADLVSATDAAESFAGEPLRRQERLAEIPGEMTAVQQELTDVTEQLDLPAPANEAPFETRARVTSLQARFLAANARLAELQNEQAAYAATVDVLPLRRNLADERVSELQTQIDALQAALLKRQQAEVQNTTDDLREDLAKVSGPLKSLAEQNIRLSELHQQLIVEAGEASQSLDEIRQATQTAEAERKTSQERVKAVGLTDALGLMLRNRRSEYKRLRQKYLPSDDQQDRIQTLQVMAFQLDDELRDIDDQIAAARPAHKARAANSSSASTDTSAENQAPDRFTLLKKRKKLLSATLKSQNSLLQALVNGDTQRRLFSQEADRYIHYINEQVFWVRSAESFSMVELRHASKSLHWLVDPANWREVAQHAKATLGRHPLNGVIGLVIVIALFLARPRLHQFIEHASVDARRYMATIRPTVKTLVATWLLAAAWPAVFLWGGIVLASRTSAHPFVNGLGAALIAAGIFIAPRALLLETCRKDGLGDAHLGWNAAVRALLRFHLRWYLLLGCGLNFLLVLWHAIPDKEARAMTDRWLSVAIFAMFAVFSHFIFRPQSALFIQLRNNRPDSASYRIRYAIWAITLGMPAILICMSLAGYLDTAFRLGYSFQFSLALLVMVVILVALVFRWLTLRYRDIAIKQAREKREKQRATAEASKSELLSDEVGIQLVEEDSTDLPALDRQTRQTVSTLATVLSLIGLAFIWSDVLPALDVLERVQIGSVGTGSEIRIFTLKDVVGIAIVTAATIYAVQTFPGLLEMIILQRSSMDSGARYAWTTILRYLLIVAGILLVMNMLSVPYQQLGWLLAAASVGLGFGMQEIFANFVSGIILLLERPVRVGDVVTIDDTTGVVSRIKMRATTVTSWDRKELVVPNKDLITEKLLNWSLSNVINRITIDVGVEYGADPDEVRKLLERVVSMHPDVMADPAPLVNLEEFGDNSLNYSVRFFLATLDRRVGVTHEINAAVLRALREAQISIPFPQRDLHIKVEGDPRDASKNSPDLDQGQSP